MNIFGKFQFLKNYMQMLDIFLVKFYRLNEFSGKFHEIFEVITEKF